MRTISERAYSGKGNWRPMAVAEYLDQEIGALSRKNAITHPLSQIPGYATAMFQVNPDAPLIFLLHFFQRLCILPGQTKSFHILLDTIPPCLPRTSPWCSSFHFYRCTTFNPVSIILMFYVSKPSQSLPFLITKLTVLSILHSSSFVLR